MVLWGTQACWPRVSSPTREYAVQVIHQHTHIAPCEEATFTEGVGEPRRIPTDYIELCPRFQETGMSFIIQAVTRFWRKDTTNKIGAVSKWLDYT
jgi:hypothetical protein